MVEGLDRRELLAWGARLALGAAVAPLGLGLLGCSDDGSAAPAASTRPSAAPTNTLLFLLDDARWDALRFMPNTRRLARQYGVEFTWAWAPSPVCIPSRANLYYGQHASRTNVWAIDPDELVNAVAAGTWSETDNIGRWLHDAGVRTAHLAKYHSNNPTPLAEWGWDYVRTIDPQQSHRPGPNVVVYDEDGATGPLGGWHSAYFRDRCLDHIAAASTADQPWSIFWMTSSPHTPFESLIRHQDLFTDLGEEWTQPQDGTGWPAWITSRPPVTDWNSVRVWMQLQARECLDADEHLAMVLDQVDLDNTLVIVSSDNGLHYGDHRMAGPGTKNTLYSAAARVPLVVFGAGAQRLAGREIDVPVSLTDVTATMLAAHGVEAPVVQDGIDLLAIAQHPDAHDDRHVYLFRRSASGGPFADDLPQQVAAVTGTAKLIHSDVEGPDEWELYDLEGDPGELVNLAADPGWAAVRSDLEARLAEVPGL